MKKVCAVCEKQFDPHHMLSKTCSEQCRKIRKSITTKTWFRKNPEARKRYNNSQDRRSKMLVWQQEFRHRHRVKLREDAREIRRKRSTAYAALKELGIII